MTLTELFTNIANAIRGKTGGTDKLKPTDFATQISSITTTKHTKSQVLTNQRRRDSTGGLSASWSASRDIFIAASGKCNNETKSTYRIWAKKSDGTSVTVVSGSQQSGAISLCGYCEDCISAGVDVSWGGSDGNYSDTALEIVGLYD